MRSALFLGIKRRGAIQNEVSSERVIELREILAVLIRPAAKPKLTGRLVARGINTLVDMTVTELKEEDMINNEALKIHSGMLIVRKMRSAGKAGTRYVIRSPEDAAAYWMFEMRRKEVTVSLHTNVN